MKRFIPYARQSVDSDDIKAVADVLRSDYLTQGPKVHEFEKKVADYCGAKYAVALNSGTSALHAACFVSGIKQGDEVITSPISFAASSNCVLYCGGTPKFVDILEDTIAIDPCEIQKAITKRTKAIIPVDFAGHPAELNEIKRIASKYGLVVIEDAAHALGAEYRGNKTGCGKYSDMTILSFHAVKHITTGEGGMVLTNRKDLYDKLVMFRTHGITRDKKMLLDKNKPEWFYEMQFPGFNYRIADIQCALGLSQMEKLDSFVKMRRKIAGLYKESFSDINDITCLTERKYAKSSWHIFPVCIKRNRDMVFDRLRRRGIGANLHYIPIYLHPYYKKLGYKKGLCPKAEGYYKKTITLPLYPVMSINQVERVINAVKDAANSL
ncbi:MAG: UDP-4-amino-4,6-dideoxy-N-acetyl-beta-L-altrosamine transaminase [Candidatus Gorgyraea atricola]|nr:UDP-4-amino-4,6-dideoxy-N-acetyl-beta-L-altrosamine transaminase [Candidatus Gorgyraea atricola]